MHKFLLRKNPFNVTMDNGHLYNTLSVRQVRSKTLRPLHVQKPHELAQVVMSDTVMAMMTRMMTRMMAMMTRMMTMMAKTKTKTMMIRTKDFVDELMRFCLHRNCPGETEKERLLLCYQISNQVC